MKGLVAAVLVHKGLGKGGVAKSLEGEGRQMMPETSKALLGPEVWANVRCEIRVITTVIYR